LHQNNLTLKEKMSAKFFTFFIGLLATTLISATPPNMEKTPYFPTSSVKETILMNRENTNEDGIYGIVKFMGSNKLSMLFLLGMVFF
jgi:hypothetical protein